MGIDAQDQSASTITVSVVIPTYDRPHLLHRAVESALNQSYPPFEIIVVDDHSQGEATKAVVESFPKTAVKYVRHEKRMGANAARNTGIRLSRGEVIAFLDDDDRWLGEKLRKQIGALASDPTLGAIYCGSCELDIRSGRRRPVIRRAYPAGDLFHRMLVRDVTNGTPTYVIRKECFQRVGDFDEHLPARQDWDLWIRISEKFRIGCVPEILVETGEHDGPRVRTSPEKSIRANRLIFRKYEDARKRAGIQIRLSSRSAYYGAIATIHAFSQFQRWKAILYYLLSIACWPVNGSSYSGLIKAGLPLGWRVRLRGIYGSALLALQIRYTPNPE